jgi:hypothetical protein
MFAHLLGDIGLDGAGVRSLVGDSQLRKVLEYRLALDFQFARQIIDANLAHFPSFFVPSHNCGQGKPALTALQVPLP